jgi:hypothetical protein
MRVLDARGRLRAKVGGRVRLSGGYTKRSILEQGPVPLEAETAGELFEHCPGRYFLTQDEGMRRLR